MPLIPADVSGTFQRAMPTFPVLVRLPACHTDLHVRSSVAGFNEVDESAARVGIPSIMRHDAFVL
jgi:hypothetical protein